MANSSQQNNVVVPPPAYREDAGSFLYKLISGIIGGVILLMCGYLVQLASDISKKLSLVEKNTAVMQSEFNYSKRELERRLDQNEEGDKVRDSRINQLEKEVLKR